MATSIALVSTVSSANMGVVFANENADLEVNLSDFKVTMDGPGRVLVEFTTDKDIDSRRCRLHRTKR